MRASVRLFGILLTSALGLLACSASVRGEGVAMYGAMPSTNETTAAPHSPLGELTLRRPSPFHDSRLFPPGFQIPVLRRFIQPPHFRRGDPDDPGRHVGLGHPLEGTSWLNRPYQAGWLFGSIYGNTLIPGRVEQSSGQFGGYRIGWDFDHYWGTEARFAFANIDLRDASGTAPRTGENWLGDVNLLYYPWGDAQWRPFFTCGMGFARFRFHDDTGHHVDETVFGFPLGGGVKYLHRKWLAVRLSLMDNVAIGAYDLGTQHNVSLTGGVEVRFGGARRSYVPHSASQHLW